MTILHTRPAESPPGSTVALLLYGSHAHGTAVEGSDEDWRGVYQLPNDAFLGLFPPKTTWQREPDTVAWELGHFCRLLLQGNPNIVGMLYVPTDCVYDSGAAWSQLVEMRQRFLSQSMVSAYTGWIRQEMKTPASKMTPKRTSHLVRLLFELESAVNVGMLAIRPTGNQHDMIMAAKLGRWPLEDVVPFVQDRLQKLDTSRLPEAPYREVGQLLLDARHAS